MARSLFNELQSEELYTFIPHDAPKSISALEKKYKKWSARHSPDQSELWLNYAIFDLKLKKYVGTIQATVELKGSTYIAYEIFPIYWRRGYATEATSKLISHLFSSYQNNVITAHLDTKKHSVH